jgi:GH18 family chitinase
VRNPSVRLSIVSYLFHIVAKGNYIKNTGLAGFAMWEAGGDYYDILLDAIRSGMGVAY